MVGGLGAVRCGSVGALLAEGAFLQLKRQNIGSVFQKKRKKHTENPDLYLFFSSGMDYSSWMV